MINVFVGTLLYIGLGAIGGWCVCLLENYLMQQRIKKRLDANDIIIQEMAKSLLEQKLKGMEKEINKEGK